MAHGRCAGQLEKCQHECHVEVFDVPLHGGLGIFAAVGNVVNTLDFQGVSSH